MIDPDDAARLFWRHHELVLAYLLLRIPDKDVALAADLLAESCARGLDATRRSPPAGDLAARLCLLRSAAATIDLARVAGRAPDFTRRRLGLTPLALDHATSEHIGSLVEVANRLVGMALADASALQRALLVEDVPAVSGPVALSELVQPLPQAGARATPQPAGPPSHGGFFSLLASQLAAAARP